MCVGMLGCAPMKLAGVRSIHLSRSLTASNEVYPCLEFLFCSDSLREGTARVTEEAWSGGGYIVTFLRKKFIHHAESRALSFTLV